MGWAGDDDRETYNDMLTSTRVYHNPVVLKLWSEDLEGGLDENVYYESIKFEFL